MCRVGGEDGAACGGDHAVGIEPAGLGGSVVVCADPVPGGDADEEGESAGRVGGGGGTGTLLFVGAAPDLTVRVTVPIVRSSPAWIGVTRSVE